MNNLNKLSEAANTTAEIREPLRNYETLKFELAALGRAVNAQRREPYDAAIEREYQAFVRRLAEDQFNLAVVGQFNRGKTSLMNAVLGMDRLPTGIVPLTSAITVVRYGSRESAWVEYENGGFRHEISINDLPNFVTQEGNPGNEKQIRGVEVQLPVEILRRGFRFVDTPGLGSAIVENTATTDRFLPQADGIVFVISSDAPLSELEIEYLRTAHRLVPKLFVVVNKIDLLAEEHRPQLIRFVRERLAAQGLADLPVYAVSAREGLRAKTTRLPSLLLSTGLPEFEQDLIHFLVTDKARDFLVQNSERLIRIAVGIAGVDAELISQVERVRTRASGNKVAGPAYDIPGIRKAAARSRMCSVCVAAAQVVADFLATYQYEISHRPEVQLQHASVHGFCSLHSWQYDRLASPRGVCSAYPVVLQKIARELLESCELSEAVSIVEQVQLSSEHCPACEVQRKTENAVLQKLAASIGEFGGVLCLPHLRLLLRQLDSKMIRTLVARHGEILQRIAEDMQRFVLKHDGLRRDLISEEEKQAHHQGLALLVGDRRLASSLPREVWL